MEGATYISVIDAVRENIKGTFKTLANVGIIWKQTSDYRARLADRHEDSPLSNSPRVLECRSVECDEPLIFPSQLRLDCFVVDVGIVGIALGVLVMSEMKGDVCGGSVRLGEGIGAVGRAF